VRPRRRAREGRVPGRQGRWQQITRQPSHGRILRGRLQQGNDGRKMKTWLTLKPNTKHEVENQEFLVVKKAKELKEGDRVLYGFNDCAEPNDDTYISSYDAKEIVHVRTEDQVVVNDEHTFIHCESVRSKRGPKLAKDLVLGDEID